MKDLIGRLGLLGAGALAMYYLDPQQGRERRALLAELVGGGLRRDPSAAMPILPRRRRAYHLPTAADARSDAQLRDRIRERLGRLVSHPGAIDVRVQGGVVRLSGDVLAKERDGLLLQVREMSGVQKLINAMTAHESPAGIASLEERSEALPT